MMADHRRSMLPEHQLDCARDIREGSGVGARGSTRGRRIRAADASPTTKTVLNGLLAVKRVREAPHDLRQVRWRGRVLEGVTVRAAGV